VRGVTHNDGRRHNAKSSTRTKRKGRERDKLKDRTKEMVSMLAFDLRSEPDCELLEAFGKKNVGKCLVQTDTKPFQQNHCVGLDDGQRRMCGT
jgi:hypothetical protein